MLDVQVIRQRMLALASGVAALLGAAALTVQPATDLTDSYIVQDASLAAVKTAVEAVGGRITHELGIINALGATLTPAQRDALGDRDGIRRLHENRAVSASAVEPCAELAGMPALAFDKQQVEWEIHNAGTQDVFIDSVTLQWPEASRDLLALKLRGEVMKRRDVISYRP